MCHEGYSQSFECDILLLTTQTVLIRFLFRETSKYPESFEGYTLLTNRTENPFCLRLEGTLSIWHGAKLEFRVGLEPTHKGVADPRLNQLG